MELPSGKKIFHAGDFNWWHWADDTPENIALAEKVFKRQAKRFNGVEVDVAFFPVDGGLRDAQEWGAIDFVVRTKPKAFVAMHRVDYPLWEPSQKFIALSNNISRWAPIEPGERRIFDGEKLLED